MDRLQFEKKVIEEMIRIYCMKKHSTKGHLCPHCALLKDYCFQRTEMCPKGEGKSSCKKCKTHCYAPQQREEIRKIMRYVGPRMIFYHPIIAIKHLYHELK